MQLEGILEFFVWLGTVFAEQLFGWIAGIVTVFIAWLIRPSISFRLAKQTFGIRHRKTTFSASALSTFSIINIDVDIDTLREDLSKSGFFEKVENVQINSDRMIQLLSRIDGVELIQQLLPVENEDNEIIAFKCLRSTTITYGNIGDFIDMAISGRDAVFRSFSQLHLNVSHLPDIVIHLSWDSSALSILPWLKKKYTFDGAIYIEGTNISIHHSETGASIKSDSPTPLFKDVIRSLVVENLSK